MGQITHVITSTVELCLETLASKDHGFFVYCLPWVQGWVKPSLSQLRTPGRPWPMDATISVDDPFQADDPIFELADSFILCIKPCSSIARPSCRDDLVSIITRETAGNGWKTRDSSW